MNHARPAVGTVSVNGVRLGYRAWGDPAGPPVVLLHGSGSDAPTWDRFAARLTAAGFRSVALDLRGHATSDRTADYALTSIRDDVVHVLERMDLRDVTLVGHSVGAYAALATALSVPGRIGRLVLEDLAAPPARPAPLSLAQLAPALVTAAGILGRARGYDLRAVAAILRQVTRPDPAWWARLGEVRQPALVLSGGPSSCIPPQRLADVTDALPDARMATIPVGHRVHSLAPDRFAAEVLAFLPRPSRQIMVPEALGR